MAEARAEGRWTSRRPRAPDENVSNLSPDELEALWMQEVIEQKRIQVTKALGTSNAADIATTPLQKPPIDKHSKAMDSE